MEKEREESAPPRHENVVNNGRKIPSDTEPETIDDGTGQIPDQGGKIKTGNENWFRELINRFK
jgi:hypothetical protein